MNNSSSAPRRNPFYLVMAIVMICAVIVIAAWTATSSPVLSLKNIVTHTSMRPYALVKIVKPEVANTALPTNISPQITVPTDSQTVVTPIPPNESIPIILPTATQAPVSEVPASPTDPVILPTDSQISSNVQTPESTVHAEIVSDGYVAPVDPNNAPSPGSSGGKYILVDISEQHMYVYESGTLVYSFVSSTGMNNATRTGMFSVLDKIPNAYGATWNIWMPNWLGIYYAGSMENGIHALPILPNGATLWAGYLGVPISYGCVVLGTNEAQLLYDWADIGTPVEIRR